LVQEFGGNTDRDTPVFHDLNPPIRARYIRFRPVAWYGSVAMRVELYGCRGTQSFILIVFVLIVYSASSPWLFSRDGNRNLFYQLASSEKFFLLPYQSKRQKKMMASMGGCKSCLHIFCAEK